jgi:hypothetical protein
MILDLVHAALAASAGFTAGFLVASAAVVRWLTR